MNRFSDQRIWPKKKARVVDFCANNNNNNNNIYFYSANSTVRFSNALYNVKIIN